MITAPELSIRLVRVVFLAPAFLTVALAAYGQQPLPTDYALNAEDWELIHKAEAPLFSTNTVGQLRAWTNPQDGKKGSIELMRFYQLKGMPCRQMEYVTFVPSWAEPARTVVNWCQVATGEWKLVNPSELEGG